MKLVRLRNAGVISAAEFQAKKAQIVSRPYGKLEQHTALGDIMKSGKWVNIWRGLVLCAGISLFYEGTASDSYIVRILAVVVLFFGAPVYTLWAVLIFCVVLGIWICVSATGGPSREHVSAFYLEFEVVGYLWVGAKIVTTINDAKKEEERERQEQEQECEEEKRTIAGCALRLEEEQRGQRQQVRTERRLHELRERVTLREKQQEIKKTLPSKTAFAGSGLKAVAGMSSLKKLLREEVVDVFRNPAKFLKYGIAIPNGILLFGPPGCGKTYIARQLANELKYHFFEVSPSDISSSYMHGTTLKIRELFEQAANAAPSVLFIDEFEALVPDRAAMGGQQYKAEEVNEFLARMATCSEKGVLLIAATNAPSRIDPAVQRSGRIDKKIYVGPPDQAARGEILAHHLKSRYASPYLNIVSIAGGLGGYSSADLKLLVDEAAKLAMKSNEAIGEKHLNGARQLVPASISPEDEAQYEQFRTRGGSTAKVMPRIGFRPDA